MTKHPFLTRQIKQIILIVNAMRIMLSCSLLVFFLILEYLQMTSQNITWKVVDNTNLLYLWWFVYSCITVFSVIYPDWQQPKKQGLPHITSFIDITMVVCLVYLMGGSGTGLSILILPFLVATCLLNYGRYSLIYAAYASLLVCYEIFLKYIWMGESFFIEDSLLLVKQAALIASFFVVSLLAAFSAQYIEQLNVSVKKSQTAYSDITSLNKIVMNRMQEAAVVIDQSCQVCFFNRKALQYFPFLRVKMTADCLSVLFSHWRKNTNQPFETTYLVDKQLMYVRAIPLIRKEVQYLTLFLRLESERTVEAQTLKLASLGQLTANLAHEIRNPLSAMRQASGLLLENEEGNLIAEKLCHIIENNIIRIDKMIEDVSILNKKDRIQAEIIDLEQFFENFFQEFSLVTPETSGCLKFILPIATYSKVSFDALHLSQIIWNLCSNSWRYCSKQRAAIVFAVRETKDHQISIRVWDDGGGVPEANIPKLFDPFFTTQKQSQGTGLGLYVARELAHANKGDLRYLPKETVFELILPKAQHDQET